MQSLGRCKLTHLQGLGDGTQWNNKDDVINEEWFFHLIALQLKQTNPVSAKQNKSVDYIQLISLKFKPPSLDLDLKREK